MRSAWLKWARAVELQQELARLTREFGARGAPTYEYLASDDADQHLLTITMEWRLRVVEPFPERWSVLLGDIVTSLRAALDHAFWGSTQSKV